MSYNKSYTNNYNNYNKNTLTNKKKIPNPINNSYEYNFINKDTILKYNENNNNIYIISGNTNNINIILPVINSNIFTEQNQLINYLIINNSDYIIYINSDKNNPMYSSSILPPTINNKNINNNQFILNQNRMCNLYINNNNNNKYIWLLLMS
jgi:hypothetical protein